MRQEAKEAQEAAAAAVADVGRVASQAFVDILFSAAGMEDQKQAMRDKAEAAEAELIPQSLLIPNSNS